MSPRPDYPQVGDLVRRYNNGGAFRVVGIDRKNGRLFITDGVRVFEIDEDNVYTGENRSNNIRRINSWLRINGLDMTLRRDPSGYFYFTGPDASVRVSGVYVYAQDHLSIERWASEAIDAIDTEVL